MRIASLLLLVCLFAPPGALGGALDGSSRSAHAAQVLLGPDTWSRVIRIENENRRGDYPRRFHALVFELAGILWFYTDVNGTQSLSTHAGRLERDKADFTLLLRAIDSGFRRWSFVAPATVKPKEVESLPNGCFIASVAAWRRIAAHDADASEPRLLSYYAANASLPGHTVLAYRRGAFLFVLDPAQSGRPQRFSAQGSGDALALARQLAGIRTVVKARFLPLPGTRSDTVLAVSEPPSQTRKAS